MPARHAAESYRQSLRKAQAYWIHGKPAQAILQLNKAWSADLPRDHSVLLAHPPPYAALAWLLRAASMADAGFLGNPVRHFQHLATRVSGERREIRSWRAWLCFHIALQQLPVADFPPDGRQMAREGLWIPAPQRALVALDRHGWRLEARAAAAALRWQG